MVGLLVLDRADHAKCWVQPSRLYQSTQAAVAYSTSARVLAGPGRKTVVRAVSDETLLRPGVARTQNANRFARSAPRPSNICSST